jgi:uncharacterized protein YqgV (UPF0045/DUF77 family)
MIAAQISYYPLKSREINDEVDEVLNIIHNYDLGVKSNEMSTIVAGETGKIHQMLQEITETMQSRQQEFVMNVTFSTSCSWNP